MDKAPREAYSPRNDDNQNRQNVWKRDEIDTDSSSV